jgi:hypothetical protein
VGRDDGGIKEESEELDDGVKVEEGDDFFTTCLSRFVRQQNVVHSGISNSL